MPEEISWGQTWVNCSGSAFSEGNELIVALLISDVNFDNTRGATLL